MDTLDTYTIWSESYAGMICSAAVRKKHKQLYRSNHDDNNDHDHDNHHNHNDDNT